MKKLILVSVVLFSGVIACAQTKKVKEQTPMTTTTTTEKTETEEGKMKVKPMTTTGDKVHNAMHRRHKRYHGTKVKAKAE